MSRMVKINVAELSSPALDWAVALATGVTLEFIGGECFVPWGNDIPGCLRNGATLWRPSTDWGQGGPLISKFRMSFATVGTGPRDADGYEPIVGISGLAGCAKAVEGKTHLIAACRAIIRAILDDEVDVPAELVEGGAA